MPVARQVEEFSPSMIPECSCRTHNSPPFESILSQINPLQITTAYFYAHLQPPWVPSEADFCISLFTRM
jgi:hypothetical protein